MAICRCQPQDFPREFPFWDQRGGETGGRGDLKVEGPGGTISYPYPSITISRQAENPSLTNND